MLESERTKCHIDSLAKQKHAFESEHKINSSHTAQSDLLFEISRLLMIPLPNLFQLRGDDHQAPVNIDSP